MASMKRGQRGKPNCDCGQGISFRTHRYLCNNESIFNLPIELHFISFEFHIDAAEFQIERFVFRTQNLFILIPAGKD